MSTLNAYLIAVLGVTGIGCGSVVALEIARPEGYNSQAAYTIAGICTTVLTVLLGIIKSISNGQALEEVKRKAEEARGVAAAAAERADVSARETVRGNLQVAELKQTVESALADGGGRGP
jgi:hypothetical protein